MLSLKCLAPDGAHVTEGKEFPTIESAWNRSENMGSRWYFYPVHVVTSCGPAAIIRDVPQGMSDFWVGRRLATLAKAFAADTDHVMDYLNGKTPYCILP